MAKKATTKKTAPRAAKPSPSTRSSRRKTTTPEKTTQRRRRKPDTRGLDTLAEETVDAALEKLADHPSRDELMDDEDQPGPPNLAALLQDLEATALPPKAKPAAPGYDLFTRVEKKLRGRIELKGKGRRRAKQQAGNAVADVYIQMMVQGSYKFIRDYLDRSMGKPTQRFEAKGDAVDALRTWLTTPGPAQHGLAEELARIHAKARSLKSKPAQELEAEIRKLLELVTASLAAAE